MENKDLQNIVVEFDKFIKNPDLFLKDYITNIVNNYKKYIDSILDIIEKNNYKTFILYKKDYKNYNDLKTTLTNTYDFTEENANDFLQHIKKDIASFNYKKNKKNNFIFIQNEIDEIRIIFVIFHELCHTLQRIYNPEIFLKLPKEVEIKNNHNNNRFMYLYRKESQADLFASLLLICITIIKNENITNLMKKLVMRQTNSKMDILYGYFSLPILKSLKINELKCFINNENIDFLGLYNYSYKLISKKLAIYSNNLQNIEDICKIIKNDNLAIKDNINTNTLYKDIIFMRKERKKIINKLNNDPARRLKGLIYLSQNNKLNDISEAINNFKEVVIKSK